MRKGAEKLQKFLNSKQQGRLDGFFTVKPKDKAAPAKGKADTKGKKRKVCSPHISLSIVLTVPRTGRRESGKQYQEDKDKIIPYIFSFCSNLVRVHQFGLLSYLLSMIFVTYCFLVICRSVLAFNPHRSKALSAVPHSTDLLFCANHTTRDS